MSLKRWTDQEHFARFDGENAPDDFDGLGGYQFVSLTDIVNNFMVTYVGENKLIGTLAEHEALFHAQRGIAELYYDAASPVCSFEYELVGSLSIPVPTDFVSLVGVYYVDDGGYKHQVRQRFESGNPKSPLQDENGRYLYGQDGEVLYNSVTSETERMFNDNTNNIDRKDVAIYNGFGGLNQYGGDSLVGGNYGLQPDLSNVNGTYVFDEDKGLITVDNTISDELIVVDYITDGLGKDNGEIKIHKFLEEAVYMFMMAKIVKSRINIPQGDKAAYEQEYRLAKRRGKLRLSKVHPKDLIYTLRNQGKWIKT